jgi:predicted acylesterase/phospholipase RssA
MSAAEKAAAFAKGELELSFDEVRSIADQLRKEGRYGPVAPLLITAGRRALDREAPWEPGRRVELARLLRDHQQFGYARRLLARVRGEGDRAAAADDEAEALRQQHALCTYKDMELPAGRRLDRALQILGEGSPLEQSTRAETLGIAGAIYKRRWEVDVKQADLERSLWYYERGYAREDDPERDYAGINAAFIADRLAALEETGLATADEAERLRARADQIRKEIAERGVRDDDRWGQATLGEALFGRGEEFFDEARRQLEAARSSTAELWRLESTAMQLAELGRLRAFDAEEVGRTLRALLGDEGGALARADRGKVGIALSGGGFRASLFHIGVLARLAECGVLRHVEVLSCVSGGSILGAYYYLKLRRLLRDKSDAEISDADYVALVGELAEEFSAGVQRNLRGRLTEDVGDDWRMLSSRYSRTDRVADLLDELFYSSLAEQEDEGAAPWLMTDLLITPRGSGEGFSLRYENWLREAKVPMLVLNATTLNTGHSWQFTASCMGEPPTGVDERVDASRRLRRVYYRDAPEEFREPRLATAVAASAAVPGLFPPISLPGLYEAKGEGEEKGEPIDVELVDGGVHDNQGIASLLEQDCTVLLVSDASGQARDDEHPARGIVGVGKRSNSILMARVRGAQFADLSARLRSGTLRGLMTIHLKKGLPAPPLDWSGCQEPYEREDDALGPDVVPAGPAYGIDVDAQRALAEMRTDLDLFSDEEAHSLMAAGYAMAREELPAALPDLGEPDPALKDVQWPFLDALDRLERPGPLVDDLQAGHSRFFRRFQLWRLRRARRPKGALGRLLDRSGLPALPGAAARGLRRGVVEPVWKVASAPLALVGGLATRGYLSASKLGMPSRYGQGSQGREKRS